MLMHFGRGLVRNAIAPSSAGTFEGYLGSWIQFRREMNRVVFLSSSNDTIINVWPLIEYMAMCVKRRGCGPTPREVIRQELHISAERRGVSKSAFNIRSHAVMGTKQRVRRPVALSVLLDRECLLPW